MKRLLLSITLLLPLLTLSAADWAQHSRYAAANDTLQRRPQVVFIGNSITDHWDDCHPDFFTNNNFANRGISGQVSSQMLVRFQSDVIALRPRAVVILAGTNDIAHNNGYIELRHILENIQSMCELAEYHHITPILCSVLPADAFPWRKELTPADDIRSLNAMLQTYAKQHHITYVDYYSALADEHGGLPSLYSKDGVHPNAAGYDVMESIIMKVLRKYAQ